MIHQQDPVGLITFDEKIRDSLPPQIEADAAGQHAVACWPTCKPTGKTDIAKSLMQIAAMLRHRSLVMIFTDLLADPEPVLQALRRLRHGGHDVILFHILDEAEVQFPLRRHGRVRGARNATKSCKSTPPASAHDYLAEVEAFREALPPRMLSDRHRLRAARHQHAVRQGPDGVPRKSQGQVLKCGMRNAGGQWACTIRKGQ